MKTNHFLTSFAIVFISLFIASCTSSSNIFMSGAPVVVSTSPMEYVESTPVDSIQGEYMNDVIGLHCIVDSVAVLQLENSECMLRALDLKTKMYIDFLPIGRGSDEVVFGYFSQIRNVDGVNIIDIIDVNEHKLYSIDLDRTIEQSSTSIFSITDLSSDVGASYIIGNKRLDEVIYDRNGYALRLVDTNNAVIKKDYAFGEGVFTFRYQPLFNSSKRISPDGTKLTMAMPKFDKIHVYDITGTNHFSISTKDNADDKSILSAVSKTGMFGSHYYYLGVHDVSANHIYATYYDSDWVASEFQHAPTIQVFDWLGNFTKAIKVNERLNSIALSKDESRLYGLVAGSSIYIYEL